jgi:hypothetical protein
MEHHNKVWRMAQKLGFLDAQFLDSKDAMLNSPLHPDDHYAGSEAVTTWLWRAFCAVTLCTLERADSKPLKLNNVKALTYLTVLFTILWQDNLYVINSFKFLDFSTLKQ